MSFRRHILSPDHTPPRRNRSCLASLLFVSTSHRAGTIWAGRTAFGRSTRCALPYLVMGTASFCHFGAARIRPMVIAQVKLWLRSGVEC